METKPVQISQPLHRACRGPEVEKKIASIALKAEEGGEPGQLLAISNVRR